MKARSSALAIHQSGTTTTLARCWRLTRRDGLVLAVNDTDKDLTVDGVVYRAAIGVSPSAISQQASAAVANMEINSFLALDGFTEEDTLAGLWDGAEIVVFEVNANDLTQGQMRLMTGNIGNIEVGRNAFKAEVRGVSEALQKTVGRTVTKNCPWKFGDPDTCRYPIADVTVEGTLTGVTNLRTFTDSSRGEVDDYFGGGLITFHGSGPNNNVSREISSFAGGVFTTHLPFPFNPEIGDSYTAIPGCRKRYKEDCVAKWDNLNNYGGFPLVPGSDKVIGLGGTEGTSL